MVVVVTGAAGFIGSHICQALIARGEQVIGIDNLNTYYNPALKHSRLEKLVGKKNFSFVHADISDPETFAPLQRRKDIFKIVHLAAQAGVRYSLENPRAYARSNLIGHLEVLEFCRNLDNFEHLVYASSSSVYGGNTKVPFKETDRVDHPVSLYAATKKADELLSEAYAHLYGMPQTGLRFFTVYGPWGRPDMAYWLFTSAILEDKPIRIFNYGEMWRDFTYIDDIVDGTLRVLDRRVEAEKPIARIYNIGHNKPIHLCDFISTLEKLIGKPAIRVLEPMQPGDVPQTFADITNLERDYGFTPRIDIHDGLDAFVRWYKFYFAV